MKNVGKLLGALAVLGVTGLFIFGLIESRIGGTPPAVTSEINFRFAAFMLCVYGAALGWLAVDLDLTNAKIWSMKTWSTRRRDFEQSNEMVVVFEDGTVDVLRWDNEMKDFVNRTGFSPKGKFVKWIPLDLNVTPNKDTQ